MPRRPQVSSTTATLSTAVFGRAADRPGAPTPIPLHVGDTWREPPTMARSEAQRSDEHPHLHKYAPPQGDPTLLRAITHTLEARAGVTPEPEDIQVVPGATAGLSIVCNALLDPGEELLLPAPYWPLIRGIVAARGARAVEVPFFDRLDDPSFDPERVLENAVSERTVALYLNTPHNPTGRSLPPDVLDAMVRVAHRHDLWVLCDQAYEALWFGDTPPEPPWARADLADRAIACHTLSKSHGLSGARIGWIHGPTSAMRAVRDLQTYQTYCAARPMQIGAARALREADAWVEESRQLHARAGALAADTLGLPAPEGGTFLFFDASPHLPGDAEDALPFVERCLDAGVRLTPGQSCGEAYARWVRLSFTSVPPDELTRALERLNGVLSGA